MTFTEFHLIVGASARPVILVEGTRDLPDADANTLAAFSAWLAGSYPNAVFRTGNAEGSDSAFARGVARVDPSRLEYILPYGGHRKKAIAPDALCFPLNVVPRIFPSVWPSSEPLARSHPVRVPRPARRVAGAVENHRGKGENFKMVVRL